MNLVRGILLACAALLAAPLAAASAYEAALPAELHSSPDLCAYAPCKEVLPGAESFSERKGNPPYVEAYRGAGPGRKLAGYVFLSTDIAEIPAYSGKPVVTLVGMDATGHIAGVKVLKHSEPILLIGIPEGALMKFIGQYVGRFAGDKVKIGKGPGGKDPDGVDAISGATVTVIAENQTIMRGAYEVARQVGIVQAVARPKAKLAPFHGRMSWQALVDEGSIGHLTVHPSDLGLPETGEPYIDMYFGDLVAPDVGRNVLGDMGYDRLLRDLKPGEHAIFVAANGTASFKGSAFVRGGIFDRIQVRQDHDTFTFRDSDYQNLYGIGAAGAPALKESGIFILRNAAFSAAYPWKMVFLANRVDKATGAKTFEDFEAQYWLPARALEGGRPKVEKEEAAWLGIWKSKAVPLALFGAILLAVSVLYANRDKLVRRADHKDKRWVSVPRYLAWGLAIGFFGLYLKAQPSVTQVLTWFHSLLFEWHWELFLSDPFIFVFWWFIIVGVFFVGRGLFCGWLCPYGALSELAYKLGAAIGLKRFQFQLPQRWHDRLKWLKYAIFAALLGVSFYSMGAAEKLAEVEPFKTTFLVGVWNRSWPYVLFWSVLLAWSMLSERPFCKYLCPLGAGLAIPSTFRNFKLKRKAECDTCHACQKGCGSLAIDDAGRIDQRECLLCLDCQVLYYDDHACPPLAKERKRRAKAGEPLTRISGAGYFEPLRVIPIAAVPAPAETGTNHRERLAVGPANPALGFLRWAWEETKFHLLPWAPGQEGRRRWLNALGMGLAVVVTFAWLLSGTGRIGPAAIIAWWIGWSVYEVESRMANLPWIKEGRWWKRDFRRGTLPDIVAYVATKNLLIGTLLFAVLHSAGVLHFLARMESLQWLR
ncbi:MAG TPA: 4Fe-4S binding protein [Usitatibacter sp.]|nr:4Fe-4S binding protein [Usitatibacter sp.]